MLRLLKQISLSPIFMEILMISPLMPSIQSFTTIYSSSSLYGFNLFIHLASGKTKPEIIFLPLIRPNNSENIT